MRQQSLSHMRVKRRRPPALAASPEDAGDAIRAALLLGEITPEMSERADELRGRISELRRIETSMRAERESLERSEQALAARRAEIEALADEKRLSRTSLAAETAAARAESRRLAGQAETLRDLLDSLARRAPDAPSLKPKPSGRPPASASMPAMAPSAPRPALSGPQTRLEPAVGKAVKTFGRKIDGDPYPGMTLATRPGAQVVSPADSRVAFAGPFRSYGEMLILDVGGGALVIVSGLDQIYSEAGQWLLTGEPIGRMSDRKTPPPELYLEVRRDGKLIDPARWLDGTG